MIDVVPGGVAHLDAVDALYAWYVRETAISFDEEPPSPEARRAWLDGFDEQGPHRLRVALVAGRVAGYACSRAFSLKCAYRTSVETSVYVAHDAVGRGIGTALYRGLFDTLATTDAHRAYAAIAVPNGPSFALHQRFGFVPSGTFHEVGWKLGRFWDVTWMEKVLA